MSVVQQHFAVLLASIHHSRGQWWRFTPTPISFSHIAHCILGIDSHQPRSVIARDDGIHSNPASSRFMCRTTTVQRVLKIMINPCNAVQARSFLIGLLVEPFNHAVSETLYLNIDVLLDDPHNSPCVSYSKLSLWFSISDSYFVPIITRGLST